MNTLKAALQAAGVVGKPSAQDKPRHTPKSFKELRAELAKVRTERDLLLDIVKSR